MKKRVIITGGSEGLGLETAKILMGKGYEVLCLSRKKPTISAIHIEVDLTNKESIERALDTIKKEYSEFECLINCAGMMSIEPIGAMNYSSVEDVFKLNIIAPIIVTSGLLECIKKNESDIINVGSTIGFKAYEEQCAYGSSKWAIRGLNENLRLELKNTKTRIIGFNPGGFKSRIKEKATGEKSDLSAYMEPSELAKILVQILELPKNIEVSEIIINRK